jgi:hypothetical protein
MIKKFFLMVIILILAKVEAQMLNDPIYFNYSLIPKVDFASKNGNVSTNLLEISATVPALKIGEKIKVFHTAYYRNSNLRFDNIFPESRTFPSYLHDIRYSVIIRAVVNTNWEIVALPRIMLRSDLSQSINGNDFFPQVALFTTYSVNGNPNFKIGLGGALNNDFERNALVILGSLYYDSKKVKIEIIYPNANILYKKSENFEFGLFATVDGAISRVSAYKTSNETANYLRTFQLLVAPTATHRIYKQFFGHLKIGFVPIRSFETMNRKFTAIDNQNFDLKTSFFVRAGFSFRVKN